MSRLAPFEPLDAGLKRTLARGLFSEKIAELFRDWALHNLDPKCRAEFAITSMLRCPADREVHLNSTHTWPGPAWIDPVKELEAEHAWFHINRRSEVPIEQPKPDTRPKPRNRAERRARAAEDRKKR